MSEKVSQTEGVSALNYAWKRAAAFVITTAAVLMLAGKPLPPQQPVSIDKIELSSDGLLHGAGQVTETERLYVPGEILVSSTTSSLLSLGAAASDSPNIISVAPGTEQAAVTDLREQGYTAQPNYIYPLPQISTSAVTPNPHWEDYALQTERPDVESRIQALTPSLNQNINLVQVDTGCADIPQFHGNLTQATVDTSGLLYIEDHGTFVASQILGDSGIIPEAKLTCINAFSNHASYATSSDLIKALNLAGTYASANGKKGIINNSWGYDGKSTTDPLLNDAAVQLATQGHLVVFSNGNPNNINPFMYPSVLSDKTPGFISSSASSDAGGGPFTLAYFSNGWGGKRFILPGESVFGYNSLGEEVFGSGTSFSAPNLTAIAALYWAQNPSLTNVQLEQLMLNKAIKPNAANPVFGDGTFLIPSVLGLEDYPYLTDSKIETPFGYSGKPYIYQINIRNLKPGQNAIVYIYDSLGNLLSTQQESVVNGSNSIEIMIPDSSPSYIYPQIKIGNGFPLILQTIKILAETDSGKLFWGDSFNKTYAIPFGISYEKTKEGVYLNFINQLPKRSQIVITSPNSGRAILGSEFDVDKATLGPVQVFEIKATEILSPAGTGFLTTPTSLDNSQLAIFSKSGVFRVLLTSGISYIENTEKLFDGNVIIGSVYHDIDTGTRSLFWLEKDANSIYHLKFSTDFKTANDITIPELKFFDPNLENEFRIEKDESGINVYLVNASQIIKINTSTGSIASYVKNLTPAPSLSVGDLDLDGEDDMAYAEPGISQTVIHYFLSSNPHWQKFLLQGYTNAGMNQFVGATTIIDYNGKKALYLVYGEKNKIIVFEKGGFLPPVDNPITGAMQHFIGQIPETNFILGMTGPLYRDGKPLLVAQNPVLVEQAQPYVEAVHSLFLPLVR